MPDLNAVGLQHPDHVGAAGALSADAGARALHDDLVQAAGRRGEASVIDAALQLITALARATVAGADGASVTLRQHGRMTSVASTDETIRRMDDHQYETGEGPCLAAAAEGRTVHVASLEQEMRWPAFVPKARREGIASILSTPLTAAGGPLGALNICSSTVEAFGPHQQELAALLARHASSLLASDDQRMTDGQLASAIDEALVAREVITRAQGVYMARLRVSAVQAAATMHRDARAAEITVAELSTAILQSLHPRHRRPASSRDA